MNGLVKVWFRSLLSGLILADMIGQFRLRDTENIESNSAVAHWPDIWRAVVETVVHEDISAVVRHHSALQRLESTRSEAAALAILPLALATPSERLMGFDFLTLQPGTWNLAQLLIQRLWQLSGLTVPGVPLFTFPSEEPTVATAILGTSEGHILQRLEVLGCSCQHQFVLVIQHLRCESDSLLFPFSGILTAARGIHSLPLQWREQFLWGDELRSRWQLENEHALWQIADQLYYRWMGRAF